VRHASRIANESGVWMNAFVRAVPVPKVAGKWRALIQLNWLRLRLNGFRVFINKQLLHNKTYNNSMDNNILIVIH
jgi:hypothetical protein